jgi:T5SS/PEP-CTERM-associated repeat protein
MRFEPVRQGSKFCQTSIFGLLFTLACVTAAHSQSPILAAWVGSSQGDWNDQSNWVCYFSGGSAPCVPNDTMGNTFTVNIDNSDAVVNLSPTVASLALGVNVGDTGGSLSLGAGNELTVTGELDSGVSIPGSMNLTNRGVLSDATATIALGMGSRGSAVTVRGGGTQWNTSGELDVGVNDSGTLTVDAGAAVTAANMNLGEYATGVGTVTVSGSKAKLTVTTGNLNVAGNGGQTQDAQGMLTISNGGVVNATPTSSSNGILVGTGIGSKGTASVSGAHSQMNAGLIYVGSADGDGTLTVSRGALVSCASFCGIGIGANNAGNSITTITGKGSQWNNTQQQLTIGYDSAGTLNIEKGGVVSSVVGTSSSVTSGLLGVSGGSGTLLVSDAGSQWNQNGGFRVGFNSTGSMTISNGGVVNDVAGSIGYESGANGQATVTGSGAVWNNSATLDIAPGAAGTLSIAKGGLVTVGTSTTPGAATLATGGTLKISAGGTLGILDAGSFTQSGGTATIDGSFASPGMAQGAGGTIFAAGAGTFNVTGGSLFGNNGSIAANVTVAGGSVTPADSLEETGMLTVNGDYTQTSAGTLIVNLADETKFDELNVDDDAVLGGTLNIGLLSGFVPNVGDTFSIINAGSISGTFSNVQGTGINSSEHFTVQYNPTSVVLQVVAGAA